MSAKEPQQSAVSLGDWSPQRRGEQQRQAEPPASFVEALQERLAERREFVQAQEPQQPAASLRDWSQRRRGEQPAASFVEALQE